MCVCVSGLCFFFYRGWEWGFVGGIYVGGVCLSMYLVGGGVGGFFCGWLGGFFFFCCFFFVVCVFFFFFFFF